MTSLLNLTFSFRLHLKTLQLKTSLFLKILYNIPHSVTMSNKVHHMHSCNK